MAERSAASGQQLPDPLCGAWDLDVQLRQTQLARPLRRAGAQHEPLAEVVADQRRTSLVATRALARADAVRQPERAPDLRLEDR